MPTNEKSDKLAEAKKLKTCNTCNIEKSIDEFWNSNEYKDGKFYRCRSCQSAYVKRRISTPSGRIKRREKEKRHYEKRKDSDSYKKRRIAIAARDRKNNPLKWNARVSLRQAIKIGKITKMNICSRCNSNGRTECHHPDYSLPLTFIELCKKCHVATHYPFIPTPDAK